MTLRMRIQMIYINFISKLQHKLFGEKSKALLCELIEFFVSTIEDNVGPVDERIKTRILRLSKLVILIDQELESLKKTRRDKQERFLMIAVLTTFAFNRDVLLALFTGKKPVSECIKDNDGVTHDLMHVFTLYMENARELNKYKTLEALWKEWTEGLLDLNTILEKFVEIEVNKTQYIIKEGE